ncbi:MAG: tetratricopeptide repeat protein [Caulobacteraceae bacterium]|nr:tetratricopeptide repeat protein [Caulobacteraceae bacterium]
MPIRRAVQLAAGLVILAAVGFWIALAVRGAMARRTLIVEPIQVQAGSLQGISGVDGAGLARTLAARLEALQTEAEPQPGEPGWSRIKTGAGGGLGQTDHLFGEIAASPQGPVLRLRINQDQAITTALAASTPQAIADRGAELVFAHARPIAYASRLAHAGRINEALPRFAALSQTGAPAARAAANRAWASALGGGLGDFAGYMRRQREALALEPADPVTYLALAQGDYVLGHDQAALDDLTIALGRGPGLGPLRLPAEWFAPAATRAVLARWRGDFRAAAKASWAGPRGPVSDLYLAGDLAQGHDPRGALAMLDHPTAGPAGAESLAGSIPIVLAARARALVALDLGRPGEAAKILGDLEQTPLAPGAANTRPVLTRPYLALAKARLGQATAAKALIEATPDDCYTCLRVRGIMALEQGDFAAAQAWLNQAVGQGPRLAFAHADLGALSLAQGDAPAALVHLRRAHALSPHYADALALMGEALTRQGKARAAARWFARADREAPRWGRNHLRWGQALLAAHDPEGARRQFDLAAALELDPAGRRALEAARR